MLSTKLTNAFPGRVAHIFGFFFESKTHECASFKTFHLRCDLLGRPRWQLAVQTWTLRLVALRYELVSLCPLVPPGHLEPCLTSHPLALTEGGRLPGPCPCVRPRVHPCRCRVGRSTSGPSRRRKQPQRQTQTCCSSKSKAG